MPDALQAPESRQGVGDTTLISDALEKACTAGAAKLKQTAMLPIDKLDYVAPPPLVERTEHVKVEAVGAAKSTSKPTGPALQKVRDAAIANSYPKVISNIKIACKGANPTTEDIKDQLTVVSEGWNAQTREYRVKVGYEGDVVVEDSPETEAKT